MSVIIALKFINGVIVGSDRQVTYGHLKNKDSICKTYITKDGSKCIGGAGSLRGLQQIQGIADELLQGKENLSTDTLVEKLNNLTPLFRKYNYISSQDIIDYIDNELLICDCYNINLVDGSLGVVPYKDYCAVGSGREIVLGSLKNKLQNIDTNILLENDAKQIVQDCIKEVSDVDIFIDSNININVLYKPALHLKTSYPISIINKCLYELTNDTQNTQYKKCKNKKNLDCTVCDKCFRIVQDKECNKINFIQKYIKE